jgi:hypothetical protein
LSVPTRAAYSACQRVDSGFRGGGHRRGTGVVQHDCKPHQSLTETARRLQVDEIVVALTERRSGSMPLRQLLDCKLSGIKVYDIATHFEKTLGQIRIDYVNAGWLIFGRRLQPGLWAHFVKRIFDLLCASAADRAGCRSWPSRRC